MKDFKRLSSFLFVLAFIQATSFANDYQPTQQGITTLTEWTNSCFKKLIEHSKGGIKARTFLEAKEFKQCLVSFIEQSKNSLCDAPQAWLDSKQAPEYLFQSNTNIPVKSSAHHPFVQKLVVPSDSSVCFIGDLHGSVHSLLRNLWRLVALGWLGNDFKLTNQKFYIIFNGDFVDRGSYGVEVIYTLLRLKLANWDNLFLLRGNHEDVRISTKYGFYGEVKQKYPNQADDVWTNLIARFYEILPFALYLGSGKDGGKPDFVQCCHGGIEPGYNPTNLLSDELGKKFERISDTVSSNPCTLQNCSYCNGGKKFTRNNYSGFNWSDFLQDNGGLVRCSGRGVGFEVDIAATNNFLNNKTIKDNNLKGFFRGHQDRYFGFKMFFKTKDELNIAKNKPGFSCMGYTDGPYHWHYVVRNMQQRKSIPVDNYAPVFTFTSAAEGQQVPYDCFAVLKVADAYEDWRLTPYEYHLEGNVSADKDKDEKNRKAQNYSSLMYNGQDLIVRFISYDYLQNQKISQKDRLAFLKSAGVAKSLSSKAINNQTIRIQQEMLVALQKQQEKDQDKEKNDLSVKLDILRNMLQVSKGKLNDLSTKLQLLRGAF